MRFDSHIVLAQATQPIEKPIHRSSTTSTIAAPSQPPPPTNLDTGRVFVALVAVLALILLLRWALRRFIPAAMARNARGIRVVGRTYLSPKQQVLVLQVGRRLLVVGDSAGQLNTLCEINDPDEAAALLGQLAGTSSAQLVEAERVAPPNDDDSTLASTRNELNGLSQRVRLLARHLSRA